MATNLVSSIMQFLTPDMVAKIARTLGIDPDVAQKMVSAAVPAILASFAGLAAKPAGAQQLSETLEQQRPASRWPPPGPCGFSASSCWADSAGIFSVIANSKWLSKLEASSTRLPGWPSRRSITRSRRSRE